MINNSTNINKSNNHLSHSLNTKNKTMTYSDVNPGPRLGQEQKCGRVKPNVYIWLRERGSATVLFKLNTFTLLFF